MNRQNFIFSAYLALLFVVIVPATAVRDLGAQDVQEATCDPTKMTLKVTPGPHDDSYWEQMAVFESGKRMPRRGAFLLEFTRPPEDGEDCIEDSDTADRWLCIQSGERVDKVRNCSEWADFQAAEAIAIQDALAALAPDASELDRSRAESRASTKTKREFFQSIRRCANNVDFAQVGQQLRIINDEIPTVNGEMVDCNSPLLANATSQGHDIHDVALSVTDYMGMGMTAVVRLSDQPYFYDCEYKVTLGQGPFTDDGYCLEQPLELTFWAEPDRRTPFQRETRRRIYNSKSKQVRSFEIKPGFTVSRSELFDRYGPDLQLVNQVYGDPDAMVPIGDPRPSFADPTASATSYQQTYENVPVEGGHYVLYEKDNWVTAAAGLIIPGLDVDVNFALDDASALEHAKFDIAAETYSWERNDTETQEPSGKLVLVSEDGSMAADSFRLAWKFLVNTYKPANSYTIYVAADDNSGDILKKDSNIRGYYGLEIPEEALAGFTEWSNSVAVGDTLYDGQGKEFQAGEFGYDGNIYYVLSNPGPPVISTWYHDTYNADTGEYVRKYITDLELNDEAGHNVYDAPEQRAAVSVHWATQKVLDYLKSLWGDASATWSDIALMFHLEKIHSIIGYSPADSETSTAWFIPKGILGSYDAMFFNAVKLGLNPAVGPDVVGHEFYHMLVSRMAPTVPDGGEGYNTMEGLADVFGIGVKCFIRGEPCDWCLGTDLRPDGSCLWNLANPNSSDLPNAWMSDPYLELQDNCDNNPDYANDFRCKQLFGGIIGGHAFYLMANGSDGPQQNELGCTYEVQPILPDPVQARDALNKMVLLIGTQASSATDDYFETRQATLAAAKMLGLSAEASIADAWNAVGVGPAASEMDLNILPELGTTEVEAWPADFGLVNREAGDWEIQVSRDINFPDPAVEPNAKTRVIPIHVSESPPADGSPYIEFAPINVRPGEWVYWRYRKKSDQPWDDRCSPVHFFKTASKAPNMLLPKKVARALTAGGSDTDAEAPVPEVDPWAAEFAWEPVNGASKYFLGASTRDDAACIADNDNAPEIIDEFQAPEGLANIHRPLVLEANTDYYYYVRAFGPDPDYIPGDCSNDWIGIPIRTKDPIVILRNPSNEGTVYKGEVTLTWDEIPGAAKYILQVSRNASFSDLIDTGPELATTEKSLNLPDEGTYYWRVQAKGPESVINLGSFSEPRSFEVIPLPAPVLRSPENNSEIGIGESVQLDWDAVSQAAKYQYEIVLRDEVGNPYPTGADVTIMVGGHLVKANPEVASETVTTTESPSMDTISAWGPGYCWRVRALGPNDERGTWSDYSCYALAVPVPEPRNPIDYIGWGYTDQNSSGLEFRWGTIPEATSYRLSIFSNNNGSPGSLLREVTEGFEDIGGSSNPMKESRQTNIVSGTGGLCWQVRAVMGSREGNPSDMLCVPMGPSKPRYIAPPHNTSDLLDYNSVLLEWENEFTPGGFMIVVSDGSREAAYTTPSEQKSYRLTSLSPDTVYEWKIIAMNPYKADADRESSTQKFKTKAAPEEEPEDTGAGCESLADKPLPLDPWGGQFDHPTNLQFTWTGVAGATHYRIDIYREGVQFGSGIEFAASDLSSGGLNNTFVSPTQSMSAFAGDALHWCVYARKGCGPWTTGSTMATSNCSGIFGVQ